MKLHVKVSISSRCSARSTVWQCPIICAAAPDRPCCSARSSA